MVPAEAVSPTPSPETPWVRRRPSSYFTTGRTKRGQGPGGQCQSWQEPLVLSSRDREARLPQKPRRRAPWGPLGAQTVTGSTGLRGAGHTGGA